MLPISIPKPPNTAPQANVATPCPSSWTWYPKGSDKRSSTTFLATSGWRLTTGDVGNRYLFQTLARNDLNEVMYRMHNHEEAPGYGFQLKYGATTLTEQWDPRQGSSWNHFMMGQIDEWFFRSLLGLRPDTNGKGYSEVTIAPEVVGDLQFVRGRYRSLYGDIRIEWEREQEQFTLQVELPANCRANILPPGDHTPQQVTSGRHTFTKTI